MKVKDVSEILGKYKPKTKQHRSRLYGRPFEVVMLKDIENEVVKLNDSDCLSDDIIYRLNRLVQVCARKSAKASYKMVDALDQLLKRHAQVMSEPDDRLDPLKLKVIEVYGLLECYQEHKADRAQLKKHKKKSPSQTVIKKQKKKYPYIEAIQEVIKSYDSAKWKSSLADEDAYKIRTIVETALKNEVGKQAHKFLTCMKSATEYMSDKRVEERTKHQLRQNPNAYFDISNTKVFYCRMSVPDVEDRYAHVRRVFWNNSVQSFDQDGVNYANTEEGKKTLLKIIDCSQNEPERAQSAAIAISLLNHIGFAFTRYQLQQYGYDDWSRIKIPGADLRYAILTGLNLANAQLYNVDLEGAYLKDTVFPAQYEQKINYGLISNIIVSSDVKSVCCSPDDNFFAVCDMRKVTVYFAQNFKRIKVITIAENDTVSACQFSNDGLILALGFENGRVDLWSLQSEKSIISLVDQNNENKEVKQITFTCDDDGMSVCYSQSGLVVRWSRVKIQPPSYKLKDKLQHDEQVTNVIYSSDKKHTAVTHGNNITVWDISATSSVPILRVYNTNDFLDIKYKSSNQLLVVDKEGWLRVWNTQATQVELERNFNTRVAGNLNNATISNDGQFLFTNEVSGFLYEWSIDTGEVVRIINNPYGKVSQMVYTNNTQKLFFQLDQKKYIHIWDVSKRDALPKNVFANRNRAHSSAQYKLRSSPLGPIVTENGRDVTLAFKHLLNKEFDKVAINNERKQYKPKPNPNQASSAIENIKNKIVKETFCPISLVYSVGVELYVTNFLGEPVQVSCLLPDPVQELFYKSGKVIARIGTSDYAGKLFMYDTESELIHTSINLTAEENNNTFSINSDGTQALVISNPENSDKKCTVDLFNLGSEIVLTQRISVKSNSNYVHAQFDGINGLFISNEQGCCVRFQQDEAGEYKLRQMHGFNIIDFQFNFPGGCNDDGIDAGYGLWLNYQTRFGRHEVSTLPFGCSAIMSYLNSLSIEERQDMYKNFLCHAAQTNNTALIEQLLSKKKWKKIFGLHGEADCEQQAMFAAVSNGHVETVASLLNYGVKPNIKSQVEQWVSPMSIAITTRQVTIVQYLCNYGASMTNIDHENNSALHLVSSLVVDDYNNDRSEMCDELQQILVVLLSANCSLSHRNKSNQTFICRIIEEQKIESLSQIVKLVANQLMLSHGSLLDSSTVLNPQLEEVLDLVCAHDLANDNLSGKQRVCIFLSLIESFSVLDSVVNKYLLAQIQKNKATVVTFILGRVPLLLEQISEVCFAGASLQMQKIILECGYKKNSAQLQTHYFQDDFSIDIAVSVATTALLLACTLNLKNVFGWCVFLPSVFSIVRVVSPRVSMTIKKTHLILENGVLFSESLAKVGNDFVKISGLMLNKLKEMCNKLENFLWAYSEYLDNGLREILYKIKKSNPEFLQDSINLPKKVICVLEKAGNMFSALTDNIEQIPYELRPLLFQITKLVTSFKNVSEDLIVHVIKRVDTTNLKYLINIAELSPHLHLRKENVHVSRMNRPRLH